MVVDVEAPRIRQYRNVLLVEPLYRRIVPTLAVVCTLAIVNAFVTPVPPGRPSKVIQLAPLKSRTTVLLLAPIVTLFTPDAGLNVTVFVLDAPGIGPLNTSGNAGSLVLV